MGQPCDAAYTAALHSAAAAAAHAAPLAAAGHASARDTQGLAVEKESHAAAFTDRTRHLLATCIRRPMREAMAGGRGGRGGRADVKAPQSSPRGR